MSNRIPSRAGARMRRPIALTLKPASEKVAKSVRAEPPTQRGRRRRSSAVEWQMYRFDRPIASCRMLSATKRRSFGGPTTEVRTDRSACSALAGNGSSTTPIPRLNNKGMTAAGHPGDREFVGGQTYSSDPSASQGGIMRVRGVLQVCSRCAGRWRSGPAHADQYDFITQTRQHGRELRVDARHDRCRQGALSRSAERGDATGGARQAAEDGIRAGRATIILISAVNNMCSDSKSALSGGHATTATPVRCRRLA